MRTHPTSTIASTALGDSPKTRIWANGRTLLGKNLYFGGEEFTFNELRDEIARRLKGSETHEEPDGVKSKKHEISEEEREKIRIIFCGKVVTADNFLEAAQQFPKHACFHIVKIKTSSQKIDEMKRIISEKFVRYLNEYKEIKFPKLTLTIIRTTRSNASGSPLVVNNVPQFEYTISGDPTLLAKFAEQGGAGRNVAVAREGSHTAYAVLDTDLAGNETSVQSFIAAAVETFYDLENPLGTEDAEEQTLEYLRQVAAKHPLSKDTIKKINASKTEREEDTALQARRADSANFKEDADFDNSEIGAVTENQGYKVWASGKLLDGRSLYLDGSKAFKNYDHFAKYIAHKVGVGENTVRIIYKGKLVGQNNFAKFVAQSPKLGCFHIVTGVAHANPFASEPGGAGGAGAGSASDPQTDINKLISEKNRVLRLFNLKSQIGEDFQIFNLMGIENFSIAYRKDSNKYTFSFPNGGTENDKWKASILARFSSINNASCEEVDNALAGRFYDPRSLEISGIFKDDFHATMSLLLNEYVSSKTNSLSPVEEEPTPLFEHLYNIKKDKNIAIALRSEMISLRNSHISTVSAPESFLAGAGVVGAFDRHADDDASSVDSYALEDETDNIPKPYINTVMYKPLNYTGYYKVHDDARGNQYRVIDGVFKGVYDDKTGLKYFDKKDQIEFAMLAALTLAAKESGAIAGNSISDEEFPKILKYIELTKTHGGASKIPGDNPKINIIKVFSALFQKHCKEMGILTGRQENFKTVGLRLAFFPDDLLETIKRVNEENKSPDFLRKRSNKECGINEIITDVACAHDVAKERKEKCSQIISLNQSNHGSTGR